MSNLQGRFVALKQIRRQAKSEVSAVFAGITESDLQFLDEEVNSSTSSYFPEDDLVSRSSNSNKDNQQNNLLNISNQRDNNSNNCDELCLSSDGLSNAENNDDMEIDHIIEEDVICVRHDLFDRSSSSETFSCSTNEASDSEAQVDTMSQKLHLWNVQYNITLDACRALLKILKPSHPELPLDPRTLNHTPRETVVRNLKNGLYAHVGLIDGLQKRVMESGLKIDGSMRIGIDINIDGINMTKSTITDVWPILCRSLDLKDSRPFVVGFFVGTGKPDPLGDYLYSFLVEYLQLSNDSFTVGECKYEIYIRCFICDAPARQYIKRIVGHASYNDCERCRQPGDYLFIRMCYATRIIGLRSDEDFIHQSDPEHHDGVSPLLRLNLKMVSQFVLDPFHLVLEGVVKRYLKFVLMGTKFGMRLRGENILEISRRLVELRKHIPLEFIRKPVGLEQLGKWKGTQLRFFLLYGGCVVLKDVVAETLYQLFLMLQIAIMIFSVQKFIDDDHFFSFAKDLVVQFVILSSNKGVFEEKFCVYNVHGLLHLHEDVKRYGEISSISAFPFESYLGILKQMLRSPTKPTQQLLRRLTERYFLNDFSKRTDFQPHLIPKNAVHGTNNYKTLTSSLFTLSSVYRRDSYFQYKGSVASVRSIKKLESGDVVIVANICDTKEPFFYYPCKSSYFGIYNLGDMKWTQRNVVIPVDAVTTNLSSALFEKKYAIADLEVTVGNEKHLDVCVIAYNWISDNGENCLYPTYLPPKKQGIATKKCMEPTAKFNTYPATIRAWFVTYEEARRKLERAVDKTDLESDADRDKANRGSRKRKYFADLSWSEDNSDENPTKVRKSQRASQKGNSLVLPTFTFSPLPEETVSTESQSINAQTKENDSLDFGSTRSDITKSQKSSTVLSTSLPRGPSKTMTALPSRPSLNVTQPGCSNSKKESNQGNRKSLNVFQLSSSNSKKESNEGNRPLFNVSPPSFNNSKKELNQDSRPSFNVSKSSISTKKNQSSQGKDRSDKGVVGKLQKSAKKHSDVSKHKNRKENKERMEKATAGKSQRPVLGIADTNEKLESSNLLASNLLESVKSTSNSISSIFLANEKDGNNIHTDFEEIDPRATSSPRGHDLTSDIFCEDHAKDSDNSYQPLSNDDSISRKSLDFVYEASQSPTIDSINLSGQEIETINEITNKTAISKPMSAKQIDKLLPIQIMRLQYEKLYILEKTHTKLQMTVEEIRQLLLNRTEVLHHPKGLPSLPFVTFEDAKTAEDLTNRKPSIKDYIVKKLMFASSGKCEKDCSKKVMALLMTNHTGTFFNWKGGKGKQPFGSWHLKETVITAVKKLRGDDLDTGKAENGIKEWLKERCFRKNNM